MAAWPKGDDGQYLDQLAAKTHVATYGVPGVPNPPQSLVAQSGSRKVLVTWEAPEDASNIASWKVYQGDESSLLTTIGDPNIRQYEVPATAGSSPPTQNIFISAVNTAGFESQKVQVQGAASVEAGAPSDPSAPAGSPSSGDTGTSGDGSTGFKNVRGGGKIANL